MQSLFIAWKFYDPNAPEQGYPPYQGNHLSCNHSWLPPEESQANAFDGISVDAHDAVTADGSWAVTPSPPQGIGQLFNPTGSFFLMAGLHSAKAISFRHLPSVMIPGVYVLQSADTPYYHPFNSHFTADENPDVITADFALKLQSADFTQIIDITAIARAANSADRVFDSKVLFGRRTSFWPIVAVKSITVTGDFPATDLGGLGEASVSVEFFFSGHRTGKSP